MRPKTTLHPSLYKLLYIALKERFIANEWPVAGGIPGEDFAIWEKEGTNGRHVVSNEFEVNYRYFYERNGWAEVGDPIVIYNDVLMPVFRYIGCNGDDVAARRQDFYRQFNVPDAVISAQAQQLPIKRKSKKKAVKGEKNYAITNANQYIDAETIQQKTVNNINYYGTLPDIPNDASAVVYAFYDHISKGHHAGYEAGWGLLSDSFKDRIWNKMVKESATHNTGLDLFKDGYYFFRSLKDTHVFNLKLYPAHAQCMVYYEEEVELPHIEELADIGKVSIKNVRTLIDKIEALAGVVEQFGGKGFSNKALFRLFYPTASETVWFEHGMDHVALKAAYPATTTTSLSRLLKCRLVKEGENWLINGLLPFHCRQL